MNSIQDIKPFLRWAGGKTRVANFLEEHLPPNFTNGNRYYEPFLGAGSLFFRLNPINATLSDNNKNLIECYKAVQEHPKLIAKYLKQHLSNNCKDYYYKMRDKYNDSSPSIVKAALFIYLNKTCFNGIWRVNKKGQFNVPYGYKEHPSLPTRDGLVNLSNALSKADVVHRDYKDIIKYAEKGDFVYFDPPYPPLNGTSYFTNYTMEGFDKNDHAELASLANILDKNGCNLMISNADIPFIRSLYEGKFILHELDVIRFIRADGKRYKVQELVITNY
ncbi:MAG: Dam family site-specific DNA-(adenine-N6)-methyltransferase [Candidatus Methanoperedens sp.]|nr:Dam family site-specific DNA-(adenine-N6)-methyltransferase [Candidatus Methanoperedens sp.]CAG0968848.1 Modification methylase DpnIIA [Methanosarcinales archaeon]